MPGTLVPYLDPIFKACVLFPFAAALFTVPFLVINYRRYGGIALMRVIVVYSFILYSMCAFLLTVLPLPSPEAVAAMAPRPVLWVPFTDLVTGLRNAGLLDGEAGAWLDPERWRAFAKSKDLFQILANVVMQVPLGIYLRYYFRCSWKKTLIIGFGVSLFYELTQLSGLFFIYPKAYRYASVDDLITNTLGTMVGYAIAPFPALLLPTRDEIDRISYRKGEHLTLLRRTLAALLDIAVLTGLSAGLGAGLRAAVPGRGGQGMVLETVCFLAYFVLLPRLTSGRTPGQALLRLRVVRDEDGERPTLTQLLIRNALLYAGEPLLVLTALMMLFGIIITLTAEGLDMLVFLLLLIGASGVLLAIVWFFLRCQLRWNTFPHGRFSRTHVVKDETARQRRQRTGVR